VFPGGEGERAQFRKRSRTHIGSLADHTRPQRLAVDGEPHRAVRRREVVIQGDDVLARLKMRPEVVEVALERDRLRIDLSGDEETAPLIDLLVAAGVRLEQVHRGKASLEEVFLTLMNEDSSLPQAGQEVGER
jgi:hypothetical protein